MAVERRLVPWLAGLAAAFVLLALALAVAARAQVAAPPATLLQPLVRGLLARTIYTAEARGPYRVEIRELVVGPGMRSDAATLPGGAVLEVRGGRGFITIDGKRQELRLGATVAVDDRHAFTLENVDKEASFSLRAVVIGPQQE